MKHAPSFFILIVFCIFVFLYVKTETNESNTEQVNNEGVKPELQTPSPQHEIQTTPPSTVTPQLSCSVDSVELESFLSTGAAINQFKTMFPLDFHSPFSLYPLILGWQIEARQIRRLLGEPELNKYKPKFSFGLGELAKEESESLLFKILDKKDIEQWENALANGKIEDNAVYYFRGEFVFLYQVLLSQFQENRLKRAFIDAAIQHGITSYTSDLIFALENKIDVQLIDELLSVSDVSIRRAFYYKGEYRSLTTYALFNGYYHLSTVLSDMKVPSYPDIFSLGAIEILKRERNKIPEAEYKAIASELKQSVQSNPHDLAVLAYSNYLRNTFNEETWNLELKSYNELVSEAGDEKVRFSRQKVRQFLSPVASNDQLKNIKCAREIFVQVLTVLDDTNELEVNKKHNSKLYSGEDANILLKKAKALFLSDEAILDYLSKDKSLYGKQALELFKRQLNRKMVEKALAAAESNKVERDEIEIAFVESLYALAKQGKWEEVVRQITNADSQETKDTVLGLSLSMGAGPNIVQLIIDAGARVHQGLMVTATIQNDTEVMRILLENGINIRASESHEHSPVLLAAKFGKGAALDFLLRNGASLNPDAVGYDALDYILMSQIPVIRKVEITNLLFDHGMSVKLSHKQIMDKMFNKKFDDYAVLITQFPQLAPN